jgi:inulin fructotransferase (DFA-I-forming)
MSAANSYDVTTWPVGDAADDIGEVITSIIADIKAGRPRPATAGSRER